MRTWTIYLFCLGVFQYAFSQDCPNLLQPLNGATNVPVETSISWENVVGVTGYIISIGTTPGGGEIVNEQLVGSDTTYMPVLGLPEATTIYVTIILFFFDQDNIVCPSQSFTTQNVTSAPQCTSLVNPENGDVNVNVGVSLTWNYAPRALGYHITIGTSPGAGDIVNNLDVGNVLNYNPPTNFPASTLIYVLITPYNENGFALGCNEESFTTGSLGEPPDCTQLMSPENGAINVSLSPFLEWEPVPNALGYRVYIGKTPFVNDILDGATFTTTSTYVLNFESNNTYFVRIVPFNNAGEAESCGQEYFSTILGCGPFYDPDTGNLISYYPESDFPDTVGICDGSLPTTIESPDNADGYRWYKLFSNGDEVLISEDRLVAISENGLYRYEVYNIIEEGGEILECAFSKEFLVETSSLASIDKIYKVQIGQLFTVTLEVSGLGDYEYSVDDSAYTDNNFFVNLTLGTHTIKVNDKKGCGITETTIKLNYPPTGFPPYFSPNGDGINDLWHYIPPKTNALIISVIYIYDRYGKFITRVGRTSKGWDGNYNNNPMPADGYWYKAITNEGKVFTGYFSLLR
ncbi:MAG: T9SS type B sorting domain-containing protein [Flavobacteriaceae bacterium]|nr:T9SS type B sorting domain-containing protein [Flavobacteriaceae bacterium]